MPCSCDNIEREGEQGFKNRTKQQTLDSNAEIYDKYPDTPEWTGDPLTLRRQTAQSTTGKSVTFGAWLVCYESHPDPQSARYKWAETSCPSRTVRGKTGRSDYA